MDILEILKDFLSFSIFKTEKVNITMVTLLMVIAAFLATSLVLRFIRKLITRKLPAEDHNKFISLFQFIKYIVYLVVIMSTLNASGVNINVFLTASAALFVGLGFALQYLFQDLISGILILLDQSLHVGDVIEINEKVVKVFEINLRTTRGLTRNNKVMVIPNHKFLTETIFNHTQNSKVTREFLHVGVAYGSDVQLVTKLLLESVSGVEHILKKPEPLVLFEDFGDSALKFGLYFYTKEGFLEPGIKSQVRYRIDALFRENGVTIPFPQRDVHIIQKKQNNA